MAETLSYVYGISRKDADLQSGAAGIAGSGVRLVSSGELAALVSTVSAEEFGEQGLRKNLEDLRWLERTVREHNRVVDAAAATSTVAPLALATVYYNDARVQAALTEQAPMFLDVLALIAGRTEWGVKAYADLVKSTSGEPAEPETGEGERPGQAYLRKIREQRKGRAEAEHEAVERASEIHDALSKLAHANRVHPPQNRDLAAYRGLMVLNGAYLVDDSRTEEFTSAIDEIKSGSSLQIELTGPWAPYSFAVVSAERQ
ncbi:GvpL/GvpF family gas vesicle protein [Saccharopolyspora shandongensis]|uniref:GvpL/GvpF family gas vesicle protein n=1 Tax=Saccharopolyspora shandongensis TaxID=418495 RepID=UPI00342E174D